MSTDKIVALRNRILNIKFHDPMTEKELADALDLSEQGAYRLGGGRGFQETWDIGGGCYIIAYYDNITQIQDHRDFGGMRKYVGVQLYDCGKLVATNIQRGKNR